MGDIGFSQSTSFDTRRSNVDGASSKEFWIDENQLGTRFESPTSDEIWNAHEPVGILKPHHVNLNSPVFNVKPVVKKINRWERNDGNRDGISLIFDLKFVPDKAPQKREM